MAKRRYYCKICSKSFLQKKRYIDHVEIHNKDDNNLIKTRPSNTGFKIRMKDNNGQTEFECSECYKTFKSKFKLIRHSYIHLDIKPFECDVCSRRFARKDHLKVHFRLHTGEKRHFCSVCCRGFSSPMALDNHISSAHNGEKEDLSCPFCEIDFVNKAQLKRHFDAMHRNTYVCNTCGFSTFAIDAMTRHEKTHILTYPLTCMMCDNEFFGVDDLKAHECLPDEPRRANVVFKVVLNEEVDIDEDFDEEDSKKTSKFLRKFDGRGRKPKSAYTGFKVDSIYDNTDLPYKCSLCSKRFATETEAKSHKTCRLGKEAKLNCPFCSKSYPDSFLLTQHLRSHTEKRPFKCDTCEKAFMRKEHLHLHNLSHDGYDLYNAAACLDCSQVFNSVESLEEHYVTDHIHDESDDDVYYCEYCNLSFSDADDLNRHNCGGIGKRLEEKMDAFNENNAVDENEEITHAVDDFDNEPHNLCPYCFKTFDTAHDLIVHKQQRHAKEENLLCVLCEKEFSTPTELQSHMNSHDDNCVLEVGMSSE